MSATITPPRLRMAPDSDGHAGYITSAHRRGFLALLAAGMDAGKVGRTTYRIERDDAGTVIGGRAHYRETDFFGRMADTSTRYRFEVS